MLKIHSCVTHGCVKLEKQEIHIVTRIVVVIDNQQINVSKFERQVDHVNIEYMDNED